MSINENNNETNETSVSLPFSGASRYDVLPHPSYTAWELRSEVSIPLKQPLLPPFSTHQSLISSGMQDINGSVVDCNHYQHIDDNDVVETDFEVFWCLLGIFIGMTYQTMTVFSSFMLFSMKQNRADHPTMYGELLEWILMALSRSDSCFLFVNCLLVAIFVTVWAFQQSCRIFQSSTEDNSISKDTSGWIGRSQRALFERWVNTMVGVAIGSFAAWTFANQVFGEPTSFSSILGTFSLECVFCYIVVLCFESSVEPEDEYCEDESLES